MKRITIHLLLSLMLVIGISPCVIAEESPDNITVRDENDPNIAKATLEARKRWNEFVQAFKSEQAKDFNVKTNFQDGSRKEYMWVKVLKINGTTIEGTLNSDPASVKNIKSGDPVTMKQSAVQDWMYIDTNNKTHGLFTAVALQKIHDRNKEKDQAEH